MFDFTYEIFFQIKQSTALIWYHFRHHIFVNRENTLAFEILSSIQKRIIEFLRVFFPRWVIAMHGKKKFQAKVS